MKYLFLWNNKNWLKIHKKTKKNGGSIFLVRAWYILRFKIPYRRHWSRLLDCERDLDAHSTNYMKKLEDKYEISGGD